MRQVRKAASVARVDACLRATIKASPRDPVALTALSLVRYGDWQPQLLTPAGREALGEARALALRSYESSPNSAAGLFEMARANFYSGNCAGGNAMGEAALALNPYDADMSGRSEEPTSELQSIMRITYGGLCLQKKKYKHH